MCGSPYSSDVYIGLSLLLVDLRITATSFNTNGPAVGDYVIDGTTQKLNWTLKAPDNNLDLTSFTSFEKIILRLDGSSSFTVPADTTFRLNLPLSGQKEESNEIPITYQTTDPSQRMSFAVYCGTSSNSQYMPSGRCALTNTRYGALKRGYDILYSADITSSTFTQATISASKTALTKIHLRENATLGTNYNDFKLKVSVPSG